MIDDFEDNQNEYIIDSELSNILQSDDEEYNERIQRSIKSSQYQRIVQKKKILFTRLRKFLRFLITLILIYLAYQLMTSERWYLPEDTISSYRIKRIEIVGNKITPTYKIVNAISNIELPHKPIYMIETDEFINKISTLASVKRVYVKRLWSPAKIVIYIEEREPVLTIAPSSDVQPIAYFSIEGKMVGREYLPLSKEYDPILVLTYGNQNDDYHSWKKEKVLFIRKLVKTIEKISGEKAEYIDMRKPDDVYIKLPSINIRLGELDSNIYNRIKDLKSILSIIQTFENKIKYIDLSWNNAKFLKLGSSEEKNIKGGKRVENSNSTNE